MPDTVLAEDGQRGEPGFDNTVLTGATSPLMGAAGETSPRTDPPSADRLDARYGRTSTRRRWNRRGILVTAAAFVVVFGSWVVWGGFDGSSSTIDVVDSAHNVVDDHTVSVTWQLTVNPGTDVRCAVQAQNEVHSIVGWKQLDVPASSLRSRSLTTVVNTTEQAVTGLIYRCWLP